MSESEYVPALVVKFKSCKRPNYNIGSIKTSCTECKGLVCTQEPIHAQYQMPVMM